jgi:hypothetical protein
LSTSTRPPSRRRSRQPVRVARQPDIIADTQNIGFFAPNGDVLVVVIMGAAAFDTDELSSAKPSVPPGKTIVLFAYVVQ